MKTGFLAMTLLAAVLVLPGTIGAQEPDDAKAPSTTEPSDHQKKKPPIVQQRVDEVVVTANRNETAVSEVGSSITVITGRQIREQQKTTVLEVLRTVPGLDVVQSGGSGGTTSVFIRGAKSEHTLVLMDGVELNDPVSAGRPYDFAHLGVDNIERIEIVRGPQSTLYGSDAMGGVINIITAKGNGKPQGFLSTEGGSFNTLIERAGVSGGNTRVNYSLGVSRYDTNGTSAANDRDGNPELDGYGNSSVSTRVGLSPKENCDIDFILRYMDARVEIDNSGGPGGDDPNNAGDVRQLFFRAQARFSVLHDVWEQKLGFSLSDQDQSYRNDVDIAHPSDLDRGLYTGQMHKFDWQSNLFLYESNIITFGVETEEEKAESDYYSESAWGPYTSTFTGKTARTTGYYLQDEIRVRDSWFTTLGVRLDDHTRFGTKTTCRLASAYLVPGTGTRIKGSLGTGFKAPSLYQLYAPHYGDETLKPEESTGWDVGVEQTLVRQKVFLGATYFSSQFNHLIDFDLAASKYLNTAAAQSKGVELFASWQPRAALNLRVSYTYTDTEDKSTGKDLLRRPRNKVGTDIDYRFLKRGNADLGLFHVGRRDDYDPSNWPPSGVKLDGYQLVNIGASYEVTTHVTLFGRVENLLDADYEEVKGYGTPGICVRGGLRVGF